MDGPLPPPARIAITGSGGVYGRALVRAIRRRLPEARVLGVDRAPDPAGCDDVARLDVRDPALADSLTAFRPDTVVHLAFGVEPRRDLAELRAVNVDGTRAVLAATAACGAARMLVASSATVYGAWPDNPPACAEDAPLRPREAFAYAAHKGIVERHLAAFAAAHPHVAVSWTRPAIICGRGVRNFLADLFLTLPCMILPDGADTPLQFVHDDDVADATLAILAAAGRGPFNVAPPDAVTQRDLARAMGIPAVRLPFALVAAASRAWWALRLPWVRTPPGLVDYLRHPWVVSPERLRRECGFVCSRSSAEAFGTLLA